MLCAAHLMALAPSCPIMGRLSLSKCMWCKLQIPGRHACKPDATPSRFWADHQQERYCAADMGPFFENSGKAELTKDPSISVFASLADIQAENLFLIGETFCDSDGMH